MKLINNKFFLWSVLLVGLMLFSGCGKKNNNQPASLNQEKVLDSPAPTNEAQSTTSNSKNSISQGDVVVQTPDPGNSAEGKAIKEVDSLLGTVSSDDYSSSSLDENELLAE